MYEKLRFGAHYSRLILSGLSGVIYRTACVQKILDLASSLILILFLSIEALTNFVWLCKSHRKFYHESAYGFRVVMLGKSSGNESSGLCLHPNRFFVFWIVVQTVMPSSLSHLANSSKQSMFSPRLYFASSSFVLCRWNICLFVAVRCSD